MVPCVSLKSPVPPGAFPSRMRAHRIGNNSSLSAQRTITPTGHQQLSIQVGAPRAFRSGKTSRDMLTAMCAFMVLP